MNIVSLLIEKIKNLKEQQKQRVRRRDISSFLNKSVWLLFDSRGDSSLATEIMVEHALGRQPSHETEDLIEKFKYEVDVRPTTDGPRNMVIKP